MELLVLNPVVLDVANRYREDIFGVQNAGDNSAMRHDAYRQFILWRHGRQGRENRRVIPSCCVIRIREAYPDVNGHYTGFRPNRLA